MKFTLSVKSFQVPTPGTLAWPPSLPSVPTSRHAGHFGREWSQLIDHRVDGVFSSRISPRTSTVIFFEVAIGHGGADLGDIAHLAGEVAGQ